MDYHRYLALLRRHILVILLLTVLGAGTSGFFALRQHAVYQATATLLINPAVPNQAIPYLQAAINSASSGAAIQQLASTYGVYLTSDAFDTLAVNKLALAESPAALGSQISSDLIGTTNFFRISVTAGSALEAQRIANGVATLFIQQNLALQRQTQDALAQSPVNRLLTYLQRQIAEVQRLDTQLSSQSSATSPTQQAELASVEARLNSLTSTYNQLLTQNDNAGGQSVNTATLIGPAPVPPGPISPGIRRDILFGTLAGLAIGALLAFVQEYLDFSIRSAEDVKSATGQQPLAVIGLIGDRGGSRGKKHPEAAASTPGVLPLSAEAPPTAEVPTLVCLQRPRDPVSEALRTLRTNLAFSTLTKPVPSLVVTSVLQGEGKSTIAANLAALLALSGKRVILVDADLRHPSLHQIFGLRKVGGFTDVLLASNTPAARQHLAQQGEPANIAEWLLTSSLQQTTVAGLQVLASGTLPSNPAEVLSSEAVVPLIGVLCARADVVIFDTPPIGTLTDAIVLSTRVQGTLLVARSGSTRPNALTKGLEALGKVGARPLGVVLNMVEQATLENYSYYAHYYRRDEDETAS